MMQQDAGVRHLPGRIATLLTLARALAGRRGWANLTWHGQGFTYTLFAVRDPYADPDTVHVDIDAGTDGLGGDRSPILDELVALLEVEP
jgi:hypothetical protein